MAVPIGVLEVIDSLLRDGRGTIAIRVPTRGFEAITTYQILDRSGVE